MERGKVGCYFLTKLFGSLFNCLKFQIKKYQNIKNEKYFKRTKKKFIQLHMTRMLNTRIHVCFLQFLLSKAQI